MGSKCFNRDCYISTPNITNTGWLNLIMLSLMLKTIRKGTCRLNPAVEILNKNLLTPKKHRSRNLSSLRTPKTPQVGGDILRTYIYIYYIYIYTPLQKNRVRSPLRKLGGRVPPTAVSFSYFYRHAQVLGPTMPRSSPGNSPSLWRGF